MAAKEKEMEKELFPHFGFISLAKKKVLLGKASPASSGANAHHSYPQS